MMTGSRRWKVVATAGAALVALAAGAYLLRSTSVEAAVRECVLSSSVADRIPELAGESTFRVEVVDLVIYRRVETAVAGERTAEVDAVIDECVDRSL